MPSHLDFRLQFDPSTGASCLALHPHGMPLPVGLHRASHYGSECSSSPCDHGSTTPQAHENKRQGCLAHHHSPDRDDSQTQGRFLFLGRVHMSWVLLGVVQDLSGAVTCFVSLELRLRRGCHPGGASGRELGL